MTAPTKAVSRLSYVSRATFSASNEHWSALRAEEKALSLIQSDILAKFKYLANCRRKTHVEPEKRLLLAVLEDGISCFQKNVAGSRPRERALFKEAKEWIWDDDQLGLFSFENICDAVGLDPNYLREELARWEQRRRARRAIDVPAGGAVSRAEKSDTLGRKGR